jgi:PKD repeat protein
MSGVAGGVAGGTPVLPAAAFIANDVLSSRSTPYPELSDLAPFDVEFRDTSGGSPSAWYWEFDDGFTSNAQDPLVHTFDCAGPDPCVYDVRLTASNANGASTAHMTVTVLPASQVDFTANRTLINPGESVTFSDASSPGGTNWAWDFGDGATTSGADAGPSHTYTAAGTYTVSLTVTYPGGDETVTKSGYITVAAGLCTVPDLGGRKFNDADAVFRGAPHNFTGHVLRDTGAPPGNFVITAQDLTATSLAPCSSDIRVTRP